MKEVITLMYAFGKEMIQSETINSLEVADECFQVKAKDLIKSGKFGFVILHSTENGIIQNLSIN